METLIVEPLMIIYYQVKPPININAPTETDADANDNTDGMTQNFNEEFTMQQVSQSMIEVRSSAQLSSNPCANYSTHTNSHMMGASCSFFVSRRLIVRLFTCLVWITFTLHQDALSAGSTPARSRAGSGDFYENFEYIEVIHIH